MKVYRVLDAEGAVFRSNANVHSGLYLTREGAERAARAINAQHHYRKYGPFSVQESEDFSWRT